jgi:membrane protease YdiL (CAAX protease family)
MVNGLPLTLSRYDTASPLSAYLAEQLVRGILGAVATGAGIAIVVAAAEPIYRERFPRQFSLGGAFSARGIQTKAFLRSVLLGYALVAFFFAYQAVFYVVAGHFGAWSPAEVPYDDMLNTALPWATVLLIGFLPAVSEEGISRMFSISFLDRLGVGRVLAVVVPAFIWGFGHSTYPNQPFYIRGLEVGLAGVLMGFLMLRYGVVPLLVWHFTVDALYTALVLLRSGNSYYVISGAVACRRFLWLLPFTLVTVVGLGLLADAGSTRASGRAHQAGIRGIAAQ